MAAATPVPAPQEAATPAAKDAAADLPLLALDEWAADGELSWGAILPPVVPEQVAQAEALPPLPFRGISWEAKLAMVRQYAEENGGLPHHRWVHRGRNLGSWVGAQRRGYASLSREQRAQLETLPGWAWGHRYISRKGWPELLQRFAAEKGRLPRDDEHFDGVPLGAWAAKLHGISRAGEGTPRRAALECVPGWYWTGIGRDWADYACTLERFVVRYNRLPTRGEEHEQLAIGNWACHQQISFASLCPSRRARLDAVAHWRWENEL